MSNARDQVVVITEASSGIGAAAASAHETWPYLAVYAASKAAVHTLSDGCSTACRTDWRPDGASYRAS